LAAWIAVLTAIMLAAVPIAADAKHARHTAGEPSPWSWIDRGPKLLAASCSAPSKCVAVGVAGAVLRSTPGQPPLAWSRVSGLAEDEDLVSVACRGSLCVAGSGIDLNPT